MRKRHNQDNAWKQRRLHRLYKALERADRKLVSTTEALSSHIRKLNDQIVQLEKEVS